MDLTSTKLIMDSLVVLSGFVIWLLFIPQIKLLISVKESKSNSLWASGLSWGLQVLILFQAILYANWSLVFAMGASVFFLTILILVILYYRRFPGGRK